MKFDNYTRKYLKRILKDLDFEATGYEWGGEEFEFLMDLCGYIEDALTGSRQGKPTQEQEDLTCDDDGSCISSMVLESFKEEVWEE